MKKHPAWTLPLFMFLSCLLLLAGAGEVRAASDNYDYLVPNCDTHLYTESEISDMSLQVLCYAKNEIYARHGRKFISKELTAYFNQQPWYNGTVEAGSFSDKVFNSYESKNIDLLSKREKSLHPGGYPVDQAGYTFDAVYAYLSKNSTSGSDTSNAGSSSGLDSNLVYDRASHTLSNSSLKLTIPDVWIGEWSYLVGKDSIRFCCKSVRDLGTGYTGIICTLIRSDEYHQPDYYPHADYLGQSAGYYYYMAYPTDVQFDPDDSSSSAMYNYMSEYIPDLI
ncbi:MAG: YARHG domain-containing protein, partial [Blautia sp.]|nr:YARHG domain-containing protein [Blautia sp.]